MSVCDVPVISAVCDFVGEGAASLITAPFDWLGQAMAGAAAWLFEAVWWVFDTTTLVDVTEGGYIGVYNILFGVAIFVMLVFFCLQLITGLVHRDPAALSRAGLGLAKSVLGSFLIIALTGLLLEITDQLCVGIVQATGNTMADMGTQIGLLGAALGGITLALPGAGVILMIFLAGLAISAAAIVWFSLLIRKALLLVAIVFGPIAIAGATWDATRGWFGKWATFVIALIFSKLVLVVIFLVAITEIATPIEFDLAAISNPIAGVVLMFIAAFAPYITYKFLSFVGFDMYHAMSSEQEAKSALNRPIPMPAAAQAGSPKAVLDGGSNGGKPGAGSGGGPVPTGGGGKAAGASVGGASAAGGAGGGAAGAGAAAGPAGAGVVAGAAVVKAVATAGPRAGAAVGSAAEQHAGAATEPSTPPPTNASGQRARSQSTSATQSAPSASSPAAPSRHATPPPAPSRGTPARSAAAPQPRQVTGPSAPAAPAPAAPPAGAPTRPPASSGPAAAEPPRPSRPDGK